MGEFESIARVMESLGRRAIELSKQLQQVAEINDGMWSDDAEP